MLSILDGSFEINVPSAADSDGEHDDDKDDDYDNDEDDNDDEDDGDKNGKQHAAASSGEYAIKQVWQCGVHFAVYANSDWICKQ